MASCRLYIYLSSVVINQTAFQDDRTLIVSQFTQSYLKLFQSVFFYYITRDAVSLICNGFSNLREEQIISVRKWKLSLWDQEWKHTPVDQVGAITLCCVFVGNICPSAKYLLTGSCLLTRRTITRFYCKDRTSDTDDFLY